MVAVQTMHTMGWIAGSQSQEPKCLCDIHNCRQSSVNTEQTARITQPGTQHCPRSTSQWQMWHLRTWLAEGGNSSYPPFRDLLHYSPTFSNFLQKIYNKLDLTAWLYLHEVMNIKPKFCLWIQQLLSSSRGPGINLPPQPITSGTKLTTSMIDLLLFGFQVIRLLYFFI